MTHLHRALPALLWLSLASIASAQTPPSGQAPADPHAGHTLPADSPAPAQKPDQELPAFIPRLTDEDRRAAFPDVEGHAAHDRALNYYTRFDRFEWQGSAGSSGFDIDSDGWFGGDRNRLWFRAEAESSGQEMEDAGVEVLFGHQFARWWDVVAGVRQDFRPGDPQTWAAVGIQGVAPYWFDVEATTYLSDSGDFRARFEVDYELLLTNRLVLQPRLEADVFGQADEARQRGAGLSSTDAGIRLRYEFRREFAPYLGVTWKRLWGETEELAGSDAESGARFVTGLRFWF